jgi:5-formyltetrahydrofolate cyclo-ligase
LFGRDGARLGYGRGYYDRVLAPLRALPSPRPLLIGVAFEGAILEGERIPMAAHDVRVDALLTERRVVQVVSREGTP